jgi:MFS family permease
MLLPVLPCPISGAMQYLNFLRDNWRFVGFGVFLTMLSSFGQTFYVALYGADIRAEYGLSNGGFGAVFSMASLVSAGALVWLGKYIDRVDLRLYTAASLAALFAGMLLLGLSGSVVVFCIAIFLVRFCGQGLCIHIASTSMARYFSRDRGKALSVSGLGLAGGEAVLPIASVILISAYGWRDAWLITAGAFVLLAIVLVPGFLGGHNERHMRHLQQQGDAAARGEQTRSWSRTEVLRDRGYHAAMFLLLAFPYIATGIFFHQAFIAASKGWVLEQLAQGFMILAIMKVITSLLLGPLIDRFGASRLVPATCLPMIGALTALMASDGPLVPFFYLGFFGVGIGMLQPIMSAMLAERYGLANLGGIRAMTTAAVVLAAAAAPATVGWMLDAGIDIEWMSAWFLTYTLTAALVAFVVLYGPTRAKKA